MGSRGNKNLRNHTFRMTGSGQDNLFGVPEQPHHKIEVKLRLKENIATVLKKLRADLAKDGMEVNTDRNNDITVFGTPPNQEFDAQRVLEKVRIHDNDAKMLSHRVLD